MSHLKTKGIVIKEIGFGEADKIITIFTRAYGKIPAVAKGAKRPRSKLVAASQFLCYSDFVFFKGREMYMVNSSEVIEPFYEIRNDMVKLTYAAHFADIINDIVHENQPSNRVLQLFLNSLHMLDKTEKSPELIARIFELRCMSIIGYAPSVNECMVCGEEDLSPAFFSFDKCGFLCCEKECAANDRNAVEISTGAARALQHIVNSSIKNLFAFNVSDEVLYELGKITHRYLRERMERDYTKLNFLKTLGSI